MDTAVMNMLLSSINRHWVYKDRPDTIYRTSSWIRVKINESWVEHITYHPVGKDNEMYARTWTEFESKFCEVKNYN